MQRKNRTKKGIEIYEYDKLMKKTYDLMEKDLSVEYCKLVRKYDVAMVKDALGKSTRLKHLKMLLSLGRIKPHVFWFVFT